MSPYQTFIVRVLEYDFEWLGEPFVPNAREEKYLFSPFVVQAIDKEDAINKVSDRTGWCIKKAIFLPASDKRWEGE